MKRLAAVFVAIVSVGSPACKDATRTSNPPPPPPTVPPTWNPPVPEPTIHANPPPMPVDASAPILTRNPPAVPAPEPSAKLKKSSYAVGDVVAAKWNGTSWWLATVKTKDGDRYDVVYGDDTTGTLSAADMLPIPAAPSLKVGDRVLACWKGPQMYTGVVTKKGDGDFEVKWDDGDQPHRVPAGKLTAF